MIEIINLINQMSPYLLLGFLLAGIMHAFLPNHLYQRYLSGSSFRSVLNATLFGIPIPLCSCGVIPTAMSLRKEGASKGATVSFLIATPQTGIDSIIATYSLLGLPFALIRPIVALITALLGGQMVNWFDSKELHSKNESITNTTTFTFKQKIVNALRYAFIDMMQDIGRWLIVGLIIAGLITIFVPNSFFALFADNSLLSMVIVLLFAIPMYLCATGSIPIAVALMLKGLSPGTALVLLMAGPVVNAASMLVVGKILGRRTMFVYIGSIVLGAILFGLGIDYLLPREWFTTQLSSCSNCAPHTTSIFNIICSTLLIILLFNALIRRFLHQKNTSERNSKSNFTNTDTSNAINNTKNMVSTPTVYYIDGLRCNHCRTNAEKTISALPNVEQVIVDLPTSTATVFGSVSQKEIDDALQSIGFKLKEN